MPKFDYKIKMHIQMYIHVPFYEDSKIIYQHRMQKYIGFECMCIQMQSSF